MGCELTEEEDFNNSRQLEPKAEIAQFLEKKKMEGDPSNTPRSRKKSKGGRLTRRISINVSGGGKKN